LVPEWSQLHDGDMTRPSSSSTFTEPARDRRWDEVLGRLVDAIGHGNRSVVVDGVAYSDRFAERLADALRAAGQECVRLSDRSPVHDEDSWFHEAGRAAVVLADGPRWRVRRPGRGGWDVVIWLRVGSTDAARVGVRSPAEHPVDADIVIDLNDPSWPVIRHIDAALLPGDAWRLGETRAFFAPRAATWDTKFGDDLPAYRRAVQQAGVPIGVTVLDLGCGTGRALGALRDAVGPGGLVIGADATAEMLSEARRLGRADVARLILADAYRLPLRDGCVDVVFAAGLVNHLPDPVAGLTEIARVTSPGGTLILFHPSGRAALAARHGRRLSPDDVMADGPLRAALRQAGWTLNRYDDAADHFHAQAQRCPIVP
jgi:SAM-dependent methyltransferase